MDIQRCIIRQRVRHIVDSYQLDGNDADTFAEYLNQLLDTYPQSLIEIALTEGIIKGWSQVPMQKGMSFIQEVHERLRSWQPELSPKLPGSCNPYTTSKSMGVTSLDVRATNHSPVEPGSINTALTPGQFEQITGLDASLVFDDKGQVFVTQPTEEINPLEPR